MPPFRRTLTDFCRGAAGAVPAGVVASVIAAAGATFLLPQSHATELAGPSRLKSSQHYRVHSELSADLTAEIVEELERCHSEFTRRIGAFVPKQIEDAGSDVYDVHLFETQAAYARFTGGEVPNSAGAFHSGKRVLCAYLEEQGHAEIKATLRHEAFHQFAHEHFGPGLPIWANEGLAQLFEHGIRVGEDLEMGQLPPGPLREVQAAVKEGRLIDFGEMVSIGDKDWQRRMRSRETGALLYGQAWAMTHFLVYAVDGEGRPLYRGRFNDFLRAVAEGTPGRQAFEANFGTNYDGFRERFERFVLSLGPTEPAKSVDDQEILAKMLILLHHRGTGFSRVSDFREHVRRYGIVLHRTRNHVSWKTADDPGVYFLDTRNRPLDRQSLRFVPDPTGELPQLIRKPGDGRVYRTRFYRLHGKLLHETTVDLE